MRGSLPFTPLRPPLNSRLFLPLVLATLLAACKTNPAAVDDDPFGERSTDTTVVMNVPAGFTFETDRDVPLTVRLLTPSGEPVAGAMVAFSRMEGDTWAEARRRVTDQDGRARVEMPTAWADPEIGIAIMFPGFPDSTIIRATSFNQEYVFGGVPAGALNRAGKFAGWDANGVPDNLEPVGDVISAGLLATVNASLPEYSRVPVNNPEYLTASDTDVHITRRADVWITFVHEGAGWKNSLGFYTYPTGSPPQTVAEITNKQFIFPNVSLEGSGGGLRSGDKVFLGTFPGGTSIGWFLVANGWLASPPSVGSGNYTVYSNPRLNPERDPTKRQHTILLSDVERELMLIAFEDINREAASCDEDFNDAIFYVSSTPYEAVSTTNSAPVTDPAQDPNADTDRDGVPNSQDVDPYDANKTLVEYDPAQFVYGSLIFEDLWPQMGDYDFNDLVLDYNTRYVTNSKGAVASMSVEFVIRAIGAGYRNGLGFELNIPPGQVKSVRGQSLGRGITKQNGNGTEAGQSSAVIIAFEDAYQVLTAAQGNFANTRPENPNVGSESITIEVEFTNPVSRSKLGNAPYNIFLIVSGDRTREIHLSGHQPTQLASRGLFGSADDASNSGNTYTGWTGLPWAMHVPRSFEYARENASITKAHKKFKEWAESGGSQFPDWYQNKPGYRSDRDIY